MIRSFISALLLFRLAKLNGAVRAKGEPQLSYLASICEGISKITDIPALRFLLLLLIPICFMTGVVNTNLISVLTSEFQVTAAHFGLIQTGLGLGAVAGAAALGPWLLRVLHPSTLLVSGTAAIGLWMTLIVPLSVWHANFGIAPVYFWCIMVGVLNALINVPLSSLFLGTTPASFRGRGSSLMGATANVSVMTGLLGGGWLAAEADVLYGTAIAGGLLMLTVIVFPWLKGYKSLRDVAKVSA